MLKQTCVATFVLLWVINYKQHRNRMSLKSPLKRSRLDLNAESNAAAEVVNSSDYESDYDQEQADEDNGIREVRRYMCPSPGKLEIGNVPPSQMKVSDIVAINGLPVAPCHSWVSLMEYIIPFSDNVFVAGSTGTWLAEFGLHRVQPSWNPSDIDVFMIRTGPLEFEARVIAVEVELATWSALSWPIRTNVIRKHKNMVNVQWWISGQKCPTLSFINCINAADCADDIMNAFDIDICRVSVNVEQGELIVRMSKEVRQHIQDHVMNCVLNHGSRFFEQLYPMLEKSIDRVEKYTDRGYRLQSLTAQSVQNGRLKLSQYKDRIQNDVLVCGFDDH
jgi:hypothetical protein